MNALSQVPAGGAALGANAQTTRSVSTLPLSLDAPTEQGLSALASRTAGGAATRANGAAGVADALPGDGAADDVAGLDEADDTTALSDGSTLASVGTDGTGGTKRTFPDGATVTAGTVGTTGLPSTITALPDKTTIATKYGQDGTATGATVTLPAVPPAKAPTVTSSASGIVVTQDGKSQALKPGQKLTVNGVVVQGTANGATLSMPNQSTITLGKDGSSSTALPPASDGSQTTIDQDGSVTIAQADGSEETVDSSGQHLDSATVVEGDGGATVKTWESGGTLRTLAPGKDAPTIAASAVDADGFSTVELALPNGLTVDTGFQQSSSGTPPVTSTAATGAVLTLPDGSMVTPKATGATYVNAQGQQQAVKPGAAAVPLPGGGTIQTDKAGTTTVTQPDGTKVAVTAQNDVTTTLADGTTTIDGTGQTKALDAGGGGYTTTAADGTVSATSTLTTKDGASIETDATNGTTVRTLADQTSIECDANSTPPQTILGLPPPHDAISVVTTGDGNSPVIVLPSGASLVPVAATADAPAGWVQVAADGTAGKPVASGTFEGVTVQCGADGSYHAGVLPPNAPANTKLADCDYTIDVSAAGVTSTTAKSNGAVFNSDGSVTTKLSDTSRQKTAVDGSVADTSKIETSSDGSMTTETWQQDPVVTRQFKGGAKIERDPTAQQTLITMGNGTVVGTSDSGASTSITLPSGAVVAHGDSGWVLCAPGQQAQPITDGMSLGSGNGTAHVNAQGEISIDQPDGTNVAYWNKGGISITQKDGSKILYNGNVKPKSGSDIVIPGNSSSDSLPDVGLPTASAAAPAADASTTSTTSPSSPPPSGNSPGR